MRNHNGHHFKHAQRGNRRVQIQLRLKRVRSSISPRASWAQPPCAQESQATTANSMTRGQRLSGFIRADLRLNKTQKVAETRSNKTANETEKV